MLSSLSLWGGGREMISGVCGGGTGAVDLEVGVGAVVSELLQQTLEREAEVRAALSLERSMGEERLKQVSALEAAVCASRMAVRLKEGYIERMRAREPGGEWPEAETALRLEIDELRRLVTVNPSLVAAHIRIAELSRQVA